ncbi:MAG: apolipoprotein N-acyltransferase, partial [Elusimicrobia bacterium]|nr:apolipoprotein N-acyltransferase [Elusimicrobiota bacterium]
LACHVAGARRRVLLFACAAVAVERFLPALVPATLAASQSAHLPALQVLEFIGPLGFAWFVLLSNASFFLLLTRPAARTAAAAAACLALLAANETWGRRRFADVEAAAAARPALAAALLQAPRGDAAAYAALAGRAQERRLVVLPESAFDATLDVSSRRGDVARALGLPAGRAFLINGTGVGDDGLARNVSVLAPGGPRVGAAGAVVEKRVLAPFGEYLPGESFLPWLRTIVPRAGRLAPGRGRRLLDLADGTRLGVLICYEEMMPQAASALERLGAQVLVGQCDDTWFSGTSAPRQHLRLSSMRAIETRRTLLHACGRLSAMVLPSGRIAALSEQDGILNVDAPLP